MPSRKLTRGAWTYFFEDSHRVRVFMDATGEPWFLADDVCNALGIANSQDAVGRLDDDERDTVVITDGIRGDPNTTIISEPGVYRLVFTSRVKKAEQFKRWLAHEVLPELRKTGTYTMATVRQAVAERFLSTGLSPWVKRFPDNFYREIFRLHGWAWEGPNTPRPGVVAYYTLDLIYARLAPDLVPRLQAKNPANKKGHRRARHHQHLSEDVGHPELERLLYSVIAIMKSATTWDDAMLMVDRIHPRWGNSLLLSLMDELLPPPQMR